MIRVILPSPLRALARTPEEIRVNVTGAVSVRTVLDAVELAYPTLRGTMRDHGTLKRRDFVRFFVCQEDWSHEAADASLPDEIVSGREPFLVVGATAGG
jgi:molybdopterin synthase sulfur carrier subunit